MKSPILPFSTTAPAIKDLVEPFLASKSRTLGPSSRLTVLSYRQTLARFTKAFGHRGPASLTPAEIASYWQGLVTRKGEPLAPATANRVLATLSAFMSWVADQGIAERNPVNGLSKLRLPDRDPGAMSEATRQEVLDRA
ncbi:MAG: phage integrase N-terminal SAM-like domain-containing protein, partial [Candidatus Sericytochromatia bacterium]|nr:phage integrase N-terminal SAM-like domain-containing protein [Candidatus Tanganyikabacteria bacterium]